MTATWQPRISDFDDRVRSRRDTLLSTYANLYGRIRRRLSAGVAAGRSAIWLKQKYLSHFRIPARLFNGVRVFLQGKVSSVEGAMELRRVLA